MRAPLLALLLSQLALGGVQQLGPEKGIVSGLVLKTGTTQPVAGARIALTRVNGATGASVPSGIITGVSTSPNGADLPTLLTSAGPPPPPPPIPTVTTDRDGKFVVPDLTAGSYRLTITLNGYVKQEYGQRIFPGEGTVLTLAAGQSLKDLLVHLTPTGNVSGRIRDSLGQPASGVPVQVLKSTFSALGQRILESAGATRTNDRGEYRLYWVTPGRYYVTAGSSLGFLPGTRLAAGGPTVTPNETVETYVFTYYPGVSDVSTASLVDVTPGSELNIDFLMTQELYKISGRVLSDVTGGPPTTIRASLAYSLVAGGGGTSTFNTPYDPQTGAFEMRDVLPGSYHLQIAAPGGLARVPLEVHNNITGLNVTVTGGISLFGRLSIEGPQEGADKFRVQLRLASGSACSLGSAGVSPVGPTVNADGTFRIENLMPADYCVGFGAANIFAGPPEYYIKEARLDREDLLGRPLQVSPSMPRGAALNIVISPNVGQVEGVVVDDKQQAVAGVQAALIPERSRNRTDLYKSATTDQNGRFTIRAVTPGDYKLFAWETLESFGYFDPDLLRKSETLGAPVHVEESSKVNVAVQIIPSAKP